ncbi:universal stress protein [Alloyangia pacifica]|uniref:Nucleotide-binding universal stress protein, UspA family n=1 Tax=Alloyangia pacifica TaxID=311180 RepID=A0A1I6PMY3_9RHOB|nr:universal stress protein [Alloyangia pacifica]SDG31827.1 Nucleotide-binding universal stress protein, UspA family [Alloyangia pacifica]SFS41571.1 Nucleotide-binding universal stress protein, UspA family [Alloyangia pacifica]
MFKRIMVPVDLTHADRLAKALNVAGDLAAHYGARLIYVGVTASTPSSIAHTPHEYGEKLAAFAKAQGLAAGVEAESHPVISHDPAVDLDPALVKAVSEVDADLVVMASHIPGLADHFWPSNGGTIASRAAVSVMVVR